ncbi:glycosyltransferase [Oceanospirillaceae bacterium]|nr:glycosyltransferase [Oceanospirillaceae bacterium]
MKNINQLSVVIPTYNREKYLDLLLEKHIDIFKQLNIPVYIFNNASTDGTAKIIEKWTAKYDLISSKNNDGEVVHPDRSFENALKLSNTKYRWLLGDSYCLSPQLVSHVSNLIAEGGDVDLYILNLNNIVINRPSSIYSKQDQILSNFATLVACVGCQVYNEKIINNDLFEKHIGTSFVQLGIVLDYINDNDFQAQWVQEYSVTPLSIPGVIKRNWSHGIVDRSVLEIGAVDWTNLILSLPDAYPMESKLRAIRNFGKQTKVFTIRGLMLMRANGHLTYANYKKFSKEIGFLVKYPSVVVIIALTPIFLLKSACIIFTSIFNRKKTRQWCLNE